MNNYIDSIHFGQTNQFLLGRGKYFVRDRDWGGHDVTSTYMDIIGFIIKNPLTGYHQLESDICNLIDSESLLVSDLHKILGIFWTYFVYRKEENLIHNDWNISNNLKEKILLQIEKQKRNNINMSEINISIGRIKTRFNYDLLKLS